MKLNYFIVLSLILTTQVFAISIFEEDDRKDWYEIADNKLKNISLSTAVKVSKRQVVMLGGKYSKYYAFSRYNSNSTLGHTNKLCSDQKFYKQIDIGSCSGFLIDDETLVTAAHCIQDQSDCNKSAWIFNYKLSAKDSDLRWGLKSNVFTCRKIVKSKFSKKLFGLGRPNHKVDFTVIKLDRSTNRKGFELSHKKAKVGQNLTIIGYPSGLPLKVASNGKVLSLKRKSFKASVDSFAGNSGSPILDSDSLEVVGILIAGKEDFYKNHQKVSIRNSKRPFLQKCNRLKVYKSNIKNAGEIVSNIDNLFR